jgi:glycosyltransferase involved in cell wall biosynthesis
MNKPLASCVCVTYNRPHLLNELLYCFLQQDYDNKELIIVNDQASIKYLYNDPRVHIYNLDERFPSLGAKREYSRNLTKGDFIFIMDDDDIYYSRHISNLLKFHLDHMEFDIVANNLSYNSVDNDGIITNNDLAFNGASIKKEYFLNNSFSPDKSCNEDKEFIQNANIYRIDGEITFHYRWGLNLIHMYQTYGFTDGVQAYEETGILGQSINSKIIELKPEISEKVKTFYI